MVDIGAFGRAAHFGWLEDGKLKLKEIYRFKNGAERRCRTSWKNGAVCVAARKNGHSDAEVQHGNSWRRRKKKCRMYLKRPEKLLMIPTIYIQAFGVAVNEYTKRKHDGNGLGRT